MEARGVAPEVWWPSFGRSETLRHIRRRGREDKPQRTQRNQISPMRHLHLQHHDGDDDRLQLRSGFFSPQTQVPQACNITDFGRGVFVAFASYTPYRRIMVQL